MDLQGEFVKSSDFIKFKGFPVEFLENRRSWENKKHTENRQNSGLVWASPFAMHLVCTLLMLEQGKIWLILWGVPLWNARTGGMSASSRRPLCGDTPRCPILDCHSILKCFVITYLVAPYRAILRYYRCDTPYRAILFKEVSTPPKWCDTPPWELVSHRHISAIPHFATYRAIIVRYPIRTSTKEFCDTIATSIARYEKYRCWASKIT